MKARAFVVGAFGVTCVWLAALACDLERPSAEDKLRVACRDTALPIDLRLAGFTYSPPRVTRGERRPIGMALSAAAHEVLANPDAAATTAGVRTRVAAHLVLGHPEEAVSLLEPLVSNDSTAELWNDYAVTLHAVARRQNEPAALAAALAAADRALMLSPNLAEAAYNRAAILDSLYLRQPATEAWRRYLALESRSEWSEKARAALRDGERSSVRQRWEEVRPHLEKAAVSGQLAVVDAVVREFPLQARTWGEAIYLTDWGTGWLAEDRERAQRALRISDVLGSRLAAINGETLLRDAVAAIHRALPAQAAPLAKAHVTYSRARILIKDRRPTEAIPLLHEAVRRFEAAGSPMAQVARYYIAGADLDAHNPSAGIDILDSIELEPNYHALRALILWERGRIRGRLGYLHESAVLAQDAVTIFERLGEREHAAKNRLNAAATLHRLGRPDEGWRLRLAVLRDVRDIGSPDLLQATLNDIARDEIADQRFDIARSFLDVLLTMEQPSPLLHFDALLWRALVRQRLSEPMNPPAELSALESSAARIADDALRADALDQLAFIEVLLIGRDDLSRTTRLLSSIIESRDRSGRRSGLSEAYLQRARAHEYAGALNNAKSDLESALSILEHQRADVASADLRDSFFDAANEACGALASLHVRLNEDNQAFAAADRCRVRILLDALTTQTRDTTSVTPSDIAALLHQNTVALYYVTLPDRLIIWAIEPQRTTRATVTVRKEQIEATSRALRVDLVKGRDASDAAHLLHKILIAPVEGRLSGRQIIVFADEAVATVPFSALRSSPNDPYLIERGPILVAPSASTWIRKVRHSSPRSAAQALIVGDPALDTATLLPRLPGAAAEARAVAPLYPHATLLLDSDATAARVLAALPASDVIHLGAHALLSKRNSRDSAILLAPSSGDAGAVTLTALASTVLPRAPTVILSGCSTAAPGGGRGSVRSLAYAFLAAGSRAVVGSLWDVEDDASRAFSVAIHRHLRAGDSTSAALRKTQMEMIRSSNTHHNAPSAWAAYQVFGYE